MEGGSCAKCEVVEEGQTYRRNVDAEASGVRITDAKVVTEGNADLVYAVEPGCAVTKLVAVALVGHQEEEVLPPAVVVVGAGLNGPAGGSAGQVACRHGHVYLSARHDGEGSERNFPPCSPHEYDEGFFGGAHPRGITDREAEGIQPKLGTCVRAVKKCVAFYRGCSGGRFRAAIAVVREGWVPQPRGTQARRQRKAFARCQQLESIQVKFFTFNLRQPGNGLINGFLRKVLIPFQRAENLSGKR